MVRSDASPLSCSSSALHRLADSTTRIQCLIPPRPPHGALAFETPPLRERRSARTEASSDTPADTRGRSGKRTFSARQTEPRPRHNEMGRGETRCLVKGYLRSQKAPPQRSVPAGMSASGPDTPQTRRESFLTETSSLTEPLASRLPTVHTPSGESHPLYRLTPALQGDLRRQNHPRKLRDYPPVDRVARGRRSSPRPTGYAALNSWTASTNATAFSTGVSGRMPWPRLKMWPGRPAAWSRIALA